MEKQKKINVHELNLIAALLTDVIRKYAERNGIVITERNVVFKQIRQDLSQIGMKKIVDFYIDKTEKNIEIPSGLVLGELAITKLTVAVLNGKSTPMKASISIQSKRL